MGRTVDIPEIRISMPEWTADVLGRESVYATDADRVALAIDLARGNIDLATGGPFGAAVFEAETGRLVSVGVNRVVPLRNALLHAEVVALMRAHERVGSYTLRGDGLPRHELVTSCEPCAMCLGAALWSGVGRLVAGATREDAERLGFDEGPVFEESYAYLERRGIEVVRGLRREEARRVLELYVEKGGLIYNG
ncbi:MAG: nucleoside deaminase [Gemmatimonadota bacterium]